MHYLFVAFTVIAWCARCLTGRTRKTIKAGVATFRARATGGTVFSRFTGSRNCCSLLTTVKTSRASIAWLFKLESIRVFYKFFFIADFAWVDSALIRVESTSGTWPLLICIFRTIVAWRAEIIISLIDSCFVASSARGAFLAISFLYLQCFRIVRAFLALLWNTYSRWAVVTGRTIEIVRFRYTDDTVLSGRTLFTVISRFCSWIGELSIFAGSGKLGSYRAKEALWTKIFQIVGFWGASETVVACSTCISAVKLALLAEVTSGTWSTLVSRF